MIQWPEKLPQENDDRVVDWTARLNGATIESSSWEYTPGIEIEAEAITGNLTRVRIKGGENGTRYYFSNSVILSDGRCLSEVAVQAVIIYQPRPMVPFAAPPPPM